MVHSFKKFNTDTNSNIINIAFNEELDEVLNFKEILMEKSNVDALSTQFWGNIKCSNEADCTKEATEKWKIASKRAKELKSKFQHALKSATRRLARKPKILVDIKSLDSFLNKVIARGKKTGSIKDVLRSAILTETTDGVQETVDLIRKHFTVVQYKNKGRDFEVDITYKSTNKDDFELVKKKSNDFKYYGSHHFLLKFEGMVVEVQVMSKRLWKLKDYGHKIYVDFRSNGDADKEYEKLQHRLSAELFDLGNKPNSYLLNRKRGK